MMKFRDYFNSYIMLTGSSQFEIAQAVGQSPQQFGQKLVRESMRADEFLSIMDMIGVDVTMTLRDGNIKLPMVRKGHGRRVKGVVRGVHYDTLLSTALSNTFYKDGVNEYDQNGEATELYMTKGGTYFTVKYNRDDPKEDKITVVSEDIAIPFITTYGSELEKIDNN